MKHYILCLIVLLKRLAYQNLVWIGDLVKSALIRVVVVISISIILRYVAPVEMHQTIFQVLQFT